MLGEPVALTVHDGRPVSRIVAEPEESMLTASSTLASIVAAPSAPIVASCAANRAASSVAMPRTTAVSLRAAPANFALADPTTPTFTWGS